MSQVIVDVREKDEFEAERIEGSIHLPLSQFELAAPGILGQLAGREIVLMCRGGDRARMASAQVARLGFSDRLKVSVHEGGIQEWRRQGRPTVGGGARRLPIMRQVLLIAGSVVLAATLLGALVDPSFLFVSAFFGAGLAFAGATGFCGMARVLELMPWNRAN